MRMLIAVGARRCTTPRASRPSAAFRPSSSSTPRSAFLPPAPMPSPHISSFTQACPSHSRSPEMHAWMMVRYSGTKPAAPPEPTRLPKALASYRPLPSPRGRASGSAREVSHLAARCVVLGAAVPWRHCHTRRRAALGKARCGRGRGSCGCPRQGLSLSGLSCPASLTCGARCADCGSDPGGAGEARGHGQGDPPEVGPRHQARLRPRPVNSPRRIAPPLPSFPSTSQQPATGRLRFIPAGPTRPSPGTTPALGSLHHGTQIALLLRLDSCIAVPGPTSMSRICSSDISKSQHAKAYRAAKEVFKDLHLKQATSTNLTV